MMRKHYELTVGGRLGPGPGDDKEATVLNRVVRWTQQGVEMEADPRQPAKLLRDLTRAAALIEGCNQPTCAGSETTTVE